MSWLSLAGGDPGGLHNSHFLSQGCVCVGGRQKGGKGIQAVCLSLGFCGLSRKVV